MLEIVEVYPSVHTAVRRHSRILLFLSRCLLDIRGSSGTYSNV